MTWSKINRADPRGRELADRHYNRRRIGSPQFVPPGKPLVLYRPGVLWVSLEQVYQDHEWPGAWVCSIFRNESRELSSDLIRSAVARTIAEWGPLPAPHRMITFVDPAKTTTRRSTRSLAGACFRHAGWLEIGRTKGGHGRAELLVLQCPSAAAQAR